MRMIYISHPYTGDEVQNKNKARLTAAVLAKEYPEIVFLNPLDAMHHAVTANLDYDTIIRQTIEILRRCNSIIMAGSWRESRGCMLEFKTAQETGMRIYDGIEDFRRNCRPEKGAE